MDADVEGAEEASVETVETAVVIVEIVEDEEAEISTAGHHDEARDRLRKWDCLTTIHIS